MAHRVPASKLNRVLRRADRRVDELEAALVPVVQPILERAGDEAARRFQKLATDHLTASLTRADRARLAAFSASERRSLLASLGLVAADLGVTSSSTMVAVKPRPDEAAAIADTDGAPADGLHVTLCFLGEIDDPLDLPPLAMLLGMVAAAHAPLSGVVGGYGQFKTETGAIGVLLPDVPGLVELRVAVTEALAHAGVDYARNHGFQPHLTVDAEPEPDEAALMMSKAQLPLHFDELLLVRGDVVEARLPLVGMPPLTASAVVATSDKGKEIAVVAEKHAPSGGYGDTAWNESAAAVYWVSADWTSNEEVDAAEADFLAIEGVDSFEYDAESCTPDGEGWEPVFCSSACGGCASLTASAGAVPAKYPSLTEAEARVWAAESKVPHELYHYTKPGNKTNILKNGFQERGETVSQYGKGVYLALDQKTADLYKSEGTAEGAEERVLIRAHANVSNPFTVEIPHQIGGEAVEDAGINAFRDHLTDAIGREEVEAARAAGLKREEAFTQVLRARGHDALIIKQPDVKGPTDPFTRRVGGNQVVVFDSSAVKPIVTEEEAAAFRTELRLNDPALWTAPAPDELVDVEALVRALKARTDPVREQFVQTFMEELQRGLPSDIGLSLDAKNPFVGKVLSQNASQVTNIAETTRSNVRRAIKEAYDQGLSIPNTANAIRAGMAEAAPARARLIARTELAAVSNGGALAATQAVSAATGDSYMKEWMTAAGARFPRHEDYDGLDGQTVPMDAYFDVGGASLQHPGDPDGDPAEVCNCRCAMSMVEGGPDAG